MPGLLGGIFLTHTVHGIRPIPLYWLSQLSRVSPNEFRSCPLHNNPVLMNIVNNHKLHYKRLNELFTTSNNLSYKT